MPRGQVFVGTSGFSYDHWRGLFYPEDLPARDRLRYYVQSFRTVEINNTFYQMPGAATFEAWRGVAPPGFRFAIKASRVLTHQKKLRDPARALALLGDRMRLLGPCAGPVLYQLPPRWHVNVARLREFLAVLDPAFLHAVEFRDPSWFTDEVLAVLSDVRAAFCIMSLPGLECPRAVTAPFVYVRFHGTGTLYGGLYRPVRLRPWATFLAAERDRGRDIYAYFNNDEAAYAVRDARTLSRLLTAADASPQRSSEG